MFHTYIRAASGTMVDFDRASFLMDRALLETSCVTMAQTPDHSDRSDQTPQPVAAYAQLVWDDYCQRHAEKYGEGFVPNVTPGWDQPEPPPPNHPAGSTKT